MKHHRASVTFMNGPTIPQNVLSETQLDTRGLSLSQVLDDTAAAATWGAEVDHPNECTEIRIVIELDVK